METRSNKKLLSLAAGTILAASTLLTGAINAQAGPNNSQGVWTQTGGWPAPPTWQGNPFAAGGVGYEIYLACFEGLFAYVRPTGTIHNKIAQSVDNSNPAQTVVHLRSDVKWSDGVAFTSKDIWAYYTLNWGTELTRYVSKIETPDPHTVVFKWLNSRLRTSLKMDLLAQDYQDQIPYHYAKKWVDEDAAAFASLKPDTNQTHINQAQDPFGLKVTPQANKVFGDAWQGFLKGFHPKTTISTGPYQVSKVTTTDMYLKKNPYYWDTKDVHFNEIHLINVPDSNQQYALLAAGKLSWMDATPPQDILNNMLQSNKNLVHYRFLDAASVGVMFNTKRKPWDNPTFRKAIIYALNRDQIRQVANYYGQTTSDYAGLGISPVDTKKWIPSNVLSKFTKYTHNEQKAAQMLESIGWKKGSDGLWRDPSGNTVHFLIGAPNNGQLGWLNSGQVVAEQLTAFGLPTQFKEEDWGVFWDDVDNKSKFDMNLDWVDIYAPIVDPWESERWIYWWNTMKHSHLPLDSNGEARIIETGFDGQSINPSQLLHAMPYMDNEKDYQHAVEELAYVTNQTAFYVNLYQSAAGDWFNMKDVSGLPWANAIQKDNRNMPLPPADQLERIAESNWYLGSDMRLSDSQYSPG